YRVPVSAAAGTSSSSVGSGSFLLASMARTRSPRARDSQRARPSSSCLACFARTRVMLPHDMERSAGLHPAQERFGRVVGLGVETDLCFGRELVDHVDELLEEQELRWWGPNPGADDD